MDVKYTYTSKDSPGVHCSDAGMWEMCTGISAWFEKLPLLLAVYTPPCPPAAGCCWTATGNSWLHFMAWALPSSANGPGLQGHGWEAGSVLLPSLLCQCWWPLGKGWRVAAWGVLVQQVSSQLCCGMKPYLIKNHTSGWHNAKQRSAARAQGWDPKQGDIKLHSCPLPWKKGECCVTGLSKKNKELDILFKGNQNLELAKQ